MAGLPHLVINDLSLSANAHQNLIEDLNEDGLSHPQNPTLDDLPVIKYRIQLIEELASSAMDKVNADAFDEAHKGHRKHRQPRCTTVLMNAKREAES